MRQLQVGIRRLLAKLSMLTLAVAVSACGQPLATHPLRFLIVELP